jgi:Sugar efflux transporter for intercellular exchange
LAVWFNLAASKLLFQQQFTPISRIDETGSARTNVDNTTTVPKRYQPPKHDYWVVGMVSFWMAVLVTIGFGIQDENTRQLLVGILVNLNLVFFYGAPLSTIVTVVRTRNTATLHLPTMLTNTANGVFWMAYGCAVLDYFIIVPNGLGALLGAIQIFLCLILPRQPRGDTKPTNNPQQQQQHQEAATLEFASMEINTENPASATSRSFAVPGDTKA